VKSITASDRAALIRLASGLPKGSETRRAILSGLSKVAMEHATEEARKKYLKEHDGADPSKHTVKKKDDKGKSKDDDKGKSKSKGGVAKTMKDIADTFDRVGDELKDLAEGGKPFSETVGRVLRELKSDDARKQIKSFSDKEKASIEAVVKSLEDIQKAQDEIGYLTSFEGIDSDVKKAVGMLENGRGDAKDAKAVLDWLDSVGEKDLKEWFKDDPPETRKVLMDHLKSF
jgi:hypothetical protein